MPDNPSQLVLKIVDDHDGAALNNTVVEYATHPTRVIWSLLIGHRDQEDAVDELRWTSARSGNHGLLPVPVPNAEFIAVRVNDAAWGTQASAVVCVSVPYDRFDPIEVRVSRPATRAIEIVYADGERFAGRVRVSGQHTTLDVQVGPNNPRIIWQTTSALRSYRVTVSPQRMGYPDSWKWEVDGADLAAVETLRLEIPRTTDSQAEIVFDLSLLQGRAVTCQAFCTVTSYLFRTVTTDGSSATAAFALYPGNYRAQVVGDGVFWISDEFELEDGETRVVQPGNANPGSLHVTAVLADGTPIKDAVLCLYPKRYVRWDEPELARRTNQGPGWAWSDDGGTICMREAPAGGYPVLLDAPGMQPREFIVSVQPGQQVDLGRVVLEPADGEVRVQVIGADEEVCYYVCLLPPGHNPSHEQSWRSGDPDTVFKPVPRREYWICLQRQDDKSGEVVSVIVDFSDGVARQVVTLDARRIGQE